MEDPRAEISDIVHKLTTTVNPDIQLETIRIYFTPDAAFDHPVCRVDSHPQSRDEIVGLYQWYRIMSPKVQLEVKEVVFDDDSEVIYLHMVQTFHIFWSPFRPTPAKLVTRLDLIRDSEGLYKIFRQTDYYQAEDLANLVLPFLSGIIHLVKRLTSFVSWINAILTQLVFGWWKPLEKPKN